MKISKRELKSILRMMINEAKTDSRRSSSTRKEQIKALMLDRPTSHGGWPEGDYDPPVNQQIIDYFTDLGLIVKE